MFLLIRLILYKKMNIYPNYIYNNINILNETSKHFCLTTFKIIKASCPLFPLLLPTAVVSSIRIAEKSWDLKTKIDNLSKAYFFSNKKFRQKTSSKNLTRKKIPYPHKKRRKRSTTLNKKKIYISRHARDIALAGIALHTQIYITFPGKVIGTLQKTVTNLVHIYNGYPTERCEIITEEMLGLITNLLLLFIIINGYEQLMLPVHLLKLLRALLKTYVETNKEEYLAAYTQVLWIGINLIQINMFYQQFFKEALQPTKIV